LIIIGVVCFDVCEEDEASRNGVFPPSPFLGILFQFTVLPIHTKGGGQKTNDGIYIISPSVYEKNKKGYRLDSIDTVVARKSMTSFAARTDLLMHKSLTS
jgi:hypothetical protein